MTSTLGYVMSSSQDGGNISMQDITWTVTTVEKYVEVSTLSIISVVGSLHNLIILLAGISTPTIRSKIHLYILNLAVADFMTTAVVIPVYTYAIITGYYPIGNIGCDFCSSFAFQNVGVSMVTNFALAINRCLLSRRRSKITKRLTSNQATLISICVMWLSIFAVFILPIIAGTVKLEYNLPSNACIPSAKQTTPKAWLAFYSMAYFVLVGFPLIGSTICYIIVLKRIKNMSRGRHESSRRRFVRTSQNLAIVFVTFVVCWLPDAVHFIIDPQYLRAPVWLTRGLLYLSFLNSAINPFIFAWRFPGFKGAIERMMSRFRPKTNPTPTPRRSVQLLTPESAVTQRRHTSPSTSYFIHSSQ